MTPRYLDLLANMHNEWRKWQFEYSKLKSQFFVSDTALSFPEVKDWNVQSTQGFQYIFP